MKEFEFSANEWSDNKWAVRLCGGSRITAGPGKVVDTFLLSRCEGSPSFSFAFSLFYFLYFDVIFST